ncbi:hypothetical protein L1987_08798 [Smallanthus sonchifolius]|uniref:Uncharacterized protein n=1 Tax=Smallanthus sonchifolius TaxID=185202 RepID=A0ACB9JNE9_9ASTR|nr:hypothetical protein L1987_08798 [Smallanthus sonchifolius]
MLAQPSGHDPTPSTSNKTSLSNSISIDRTPSPSPKRKKVQQSPPRLQSTQPTVEQRAPQHVLVKPTRRSKSVRGPSQPHMQKLPSKPPKSLKRKRSYTPISSSQDEDIPLKPTSKGDNLTEVAMENNKLLKQILLTLAALTTSTPTKVPTNATKKGENNIVKWFFDQQQKSIFIQREDRRIENLKAYDSQSTNSLRIFSALDKKWLLKKILKMLMRFLMLKRCNPELEAF